MTASHRAGCPVPLSDLRYLRLPYVGFDGEVRRGEMVVAARHAEDVVQVFEQLFEARFPIRRMVLVDEYGGDDDRSMAANNTSAYNCRPVAGTDRWSEHAYGGAIDINPVQNPYVTGSSYVPEEGAAYVDVARGPGARPEPGVIVADGVVVRAFDRIGWEWGGTWTSSKDYQHFSAGGG
jgi:poly-gamma-glutamate synthesis protein (capsule biosynthesis protein)